MKAFNSLTAAGQVRRLRRLADTALTKFNIKYNKLSSIQHGENTTLRFN